ncbi:unnamed protein product [Anisakis simplex]|uniref:Uncharacterized protein n=1 Tax=Anisakis simplex TaxID=6269 RepID=A0A0M3KK07_ANISI|nr:unnamed protein product [Anisakis simplex]
MKLQEKLSVIVSVVDSIGNDNRADGLKMEPAAKSSTLAVPQPMGKRGSMQQVWE